MKIISPLLIICFMSCVLAQAPDNVKESFKKKYPNAEDVSWGIDRNSLREAHFKIDGKKYRADFNLDGTWVETEQNIKWSELPDKVQEVFKGLDDKDDIYEIEKVDHHIKGIFYDIEYNKDGKKMDVEIKTDGVILSNE